MSDVEASCLAGAFTITLIVALFAIHSCQSATEDGACREAWAHTLTTTDTLALVRRGCSLPLEEAT